MKFWLGGVAAVLLATIGWSQPAAAQGIPRGSYLNSCRDAGIWGPNTLVATCRMISGRPLRTALEGVYRCVGDIGNNNGYLQCTLPGGRIMRGYVVGQPGPPAYAPPPPPPGYGEEWRERCRELHHRFEELRERRDRTYDPYERERIEHRLHEVREQMRGCR
jgi:hypothetical protein